MNGFASWAQGEYLLKGEQRGAYAIGGQRRDDQLAVLSQPGQPLRGRVGKHLSRPATAARSCSRRASCPRGSGSVPVIVQKPSRLPAH